jgi:hypothetical protein
MSSEIKLYGDDHAKWQFGIVLYKGFAFIYILTYPGLIKRYKIQYYYYRIYLYITIIIVALMKGTKAWHIWSNNKDLYFL